MIKSLDTLGVQAYIDSCAGTPLLHFQKDGEPFTVDMVFAYGAYHERKNASAHFLEHLLLCGGEAYANKKLLADAFESRGCSFGASTGYFNLHVRELNNSGADLAFAAMALEDAILHAKMSPASIDAERNIILAEAEKTGKEKQRVCGNLFLETLFPDTRLATDVKGLSGDIQAIDRADLVQEHGALLRAERALITSGDFHIDHVKAVFQPFLDRMAAPDVGGQSQNHVSLRTGSFSLATPLGISGVGIFFGRTMHGNKRKTAIHMFLNNLLFNKGGLLMEKLRYENPLVYSVLDYSMATAVADYFGVFAEAPREKVVVVRDALVRAMTEDLFSCLKEEEVSGYIRSSRSRERRRYRTTDALIDRYARDFLDFGQDMAWHDDIVALLEQIPIKEIVAEAREVFASDNQTLVVLS